MKFVLVVILLATFIGQTPKSQVAREAHAFLAALTIEQRGKAAYPADSNQLYNWHFVPRDRPGIPWSDLNEAQKKEAQTLLRASLSKIGYQKIEEIRALEPVLREIEGGNLSRDENRYSFAFFGNPSDTKPWAWRYEGHHLSLTFAYRDGTLVASTPQFLGSNPAEVLTGPKKGNRPLAKEQDLAHKLLESLNPAQLAKAKIANETKGDIVTGNARRAAVEGNLGLSYREMLSPQKQALMDLLRAHAEVQSEKEQARRMKQIEGEELDLVFAWMGTTERKGRHYYRIQGKNLLVEYDNSQGNGTHVHTVWRNLTEDFGSDPLKEHYEHGHSHGHRS
ncbi:MAG: DUF3500 domain-containing protein [Chlorobia bacterium]|nr:DUF3500 domain-containing protein [Fimbriimonadaceae bacterium]